MSILRQIYDPPPKKNVEDKTYGRKTIDDLRIVFNEPDIIRILKR